MTEICLNNKAVFNWSSGKDSALALHRVLKEEKYEVCCLLTSINETYQRVSMHGVRIELLEEQAKSLGIRLELLKIPESPSMQDYEDLLSSTLSSLKKLGISHSIFGDIFLEDLRAYREQKLTKMGFEAVFPLWKNNSMELIEEFIQFGFRAIVVCVDERYLDKSFVGRLFDLDFIRDLPKEVDVCGENGEFHTFIFDGPIFKFPVLFELAEVVYRKYERPKEEDVGSTSSSDVFDTGFWYCDLLLKE